MTRGGKTPVFPLFTTLLFTTFAAFVLAHHEMWRDELQAWLIARDSGSLTSFLHVMRYEGAPPLWHALLLPLSRFGAPPESMQLLHLAIGGVWVYLICRCAPFNWPLKVLLSFSYYTFYQYTVVSRNYSLGLLCLTLACVLFKDRENRPWLLGLVLATAAFTSAPALIVGSAVAAATRNARVITCYLLGALASAALMHPPVDAIFPSSPGWFTHFHPTRIAETLQVVVKAYAPTPAPGPHFWEDPWIMHLPYFSFWSLPAAAALLAGGGWLCRRASASQIVYEVGTIGLVMFYYCKYLGYSRHHGFLFFNLIFALWIGWDAGVSQRARHVLTVLLAFQLLGSGIAAWYDVRLPFSYGKGVARSSLLADSGSLMVAAGPDYIGVPVMGYRREPFYAAQGNRWQTFTLWDRQRMEMFDDREFARRARAEAAKSKKTIVMLINYPLDPRIQKDTRARPLASFTGSILGDEDYYLYGL